MNRYAQIYNGKVIYIYETLAGMDDLARHFDPSTVWYDVTELPEVEVGYIQSFNESGRMVLVPGVDNKEDSLNTNEKMTAIIIAAKVQMYMELDKLAQSRRYIDFDDCISYANDKYNTVAANDADRLMKLRYDLEYWMIVECSNVNTIEEARGIDFNKKIKELNFVW